MQGSLAVAAGRLLPAFMVIACGMARDVTASQVYTDETAFRAALGASTRVHGFDAFTAGTIIDDQLPGVDFHGSGTVATGNAHTPPHVLSTIASPISFDFAVPTDGVGFYNTSTVDEIVTYAAPGPGGTLFQSLVPPGGFLGYISDTRIGIGSIGWIGPPNSTFSIDTFIFGADPTPVPAASRPMVLALIACLAAAASLAIRRDRRSGP
jgi:hypothetical protein